jgi:ATP-dependent 26S proteasome regulatory subunit
MKNKKNEMKELTKDMNQEQKEKYKEDSIKKKTDEQVKLKLEKKKLKDKEKEAYKKLSKEEKLKLKEQKNKENKLKQTTKYIEFPYLEELDDKQYNELKNGNWVVSDPRKQIKLNIYLILFIQLIFYYSQKDHLKPNAEFLLPSHTNLIFAP